MKNINHDQGPCWREQLLEIMKHDFVHYLGAVELIVQLIDAVKKSEREIIEFQIDRVVTEFGHDPALCIQILGEQFHGDLDKDRIQ